MSIRSISFTRVVSIKTFLTAISLGTSAIGCASSDPASAPAAQHQTGVLALPITAVGASGAVYRLRNAGFSITNIETGQALALSSELDPLSSTLETELSSGEYVVGLGPGWTLEKAVGSAVNAVAATLLSPAVQNVSVAANGEASLLFQFETSGELVEFGQGRLVIDIGVSESGGAGGGGGGALTFNALIETNEQALGSFSLRGALDAAIINAGRSSNADSAYRAIIDSYAPSFQGQDPTASHCDEQLAETGGFGLNGYPLQCGRLESQQLGNLDQWFPIAAVNRLDLAPLDGSNCGQQRIVFANELPIGNGRMLMIIEAQVPNPSPACGVDACLPIAELWAAVDAESDPTQRGALLANAFLGSGIGSGFGAFINADQLGPNGGQIRTNNFNDSPWTLREFHFDPGTFGRPRPAPVGDSPNGQLWNDFSGLSQGPACRAAFTSALTGLLTDNLSAMSFVVPQACKDAESRNDFSQDYAFQLQLGGGAFRSQLDTQLLGTGLTAGDIAARARFAGSCIGCHQEASGSLLGRGVTAPFQSDFVHVSERVRVPCDDGLGTCFGISSALRDEFLPHRQQVLVDFLDGSPGCSGPLAPLAAAAPGPSPLTTPAPVRTLGGHVAGTHAH